MNTKAKKQTVGTMMACGLVLALTGCGATPSASKAVSASSTLSTAGVGAGKMAITLLDSNGATVYSDSSASSSSKLSLVANKPYTLKLSQANAIAGTTYSLVAKQTNVISGASFTVPLQIGSNTFKVQSQGDYAVTLKATPPSGPEVSSFYQIPVSCPNPTLTKASLDASKIKVTKAGTNLYNLSALNIAASANGTGPYTCAWDPTGTGIQDTDYVDCNASISKFYSNFLENRMVVVAVKDSCNSVVEISSLVNFQSFASDVPAKHSGIDFISGVTTASTGDLRVDGVSYLATNQADHRIVAPDYGGGTFKIYSAQNYGRLSSVDFGISIEVKGIRDTLNMDAGTGTIDASNASISMVTYSTDQRGDDSPERSFSGANCQLSQQGAELITVKGSPCAGGTPNGNNNSATVEVWGHYKCTGMKDASGALMTLEGDFDGLKHFNDSCYGGGGGGGGDPIPQF